MSKSKSPGYYTFTVLLLISILIIATLAAIFTGLAKSKQPVDVTNLWFVLMALLVASLVHLFFSIRDNKKQYSQKCRIENILTIILKKIHLEDSIVENNIIWALIDEVVKKPDDYQEYLLSLEPNLQETLTQFCLRAEINLRKEISERLLYANPGREISDSFSASENLTRDARRLEKYEQIRSYCK